MNDGQLRRFYALLDAPLPPFPTRLELVSYNPSTHGGRGGVRILQQVQPFKRSHVRLTLSSHERSGGAHVPLLVIATANVRRIAFCDAFRRWGGQASVEGRGGGKIELEFLEVVVQKAGDEGSGLLLGAEAVARLVEGGCGLWEEVGKRAASARGWSGAGGGAEAGGAAGGVLVPGSLQGSLVLRGGVWEVDETAEWLMVERSPANYGPARQVLGRAFLIVVGTQGSQVREEARREERRGTISEVGAKEVQADVRIGCVAVLAGGCVIAAPGRHIPFGPLPRPEP